MYQDEIIGHMTDLVITLPNLVVRGEGRRQREKAVQWRT
jgi:hypothetical protein